MSPLPRPHLRPCSSTTPAALAAWLLLTLALAPAAGRDQNGSESPRWLVIGYSQVGQRGGGWFTAGGFAETIRDPGAWSVQWQGGAGVDRWRRADFNGWDVPPRPLEPARAGAPPQPPTHVVLSISGPYGDNVPAWAEAIAESLENLKARIPSAETVYLQAVVGGPDGQPCFEVAEPREGKARRSKAAKGSKGERAARRVGGRGRGVRAAWQQPYIVEAIEQVVAESPVEGLRLHAGPVAGVRECTDFSDQLGHLTPEGARAAGAFIAEFYNAATP